MYIQTHTHIHTLTKNLIQGSNTSSSLLTWAEALWEGWTTFCLLIRVGQRLNPTELLEAGIQTLQIVSEWPAKYKISDILQNLAANTITNESLLRNN